MTALTFFGEFMLRKGPIMMDAKLTALPVKMISDCPATDSVDFGFAVYADTLAGLIANKENATPLVMGVHGPWGSGKTTLMKEIKARVDGERFMNAKRYRRCNTVWFQAWKHDREEEILAALMEAIIKTMAAHGFFSLAKARVEAITRRIDQSKIFTSISKLVNGMDVSEFFSELPQKEKLGHSNTFQKFIDDLLWTFLTWRFNLGGQEKPDDRKCAMVIFIDDLDRCPPGYIVKLLETLTLFMDRSGCIFILGASYEALEDALAMRYGLKGARRFLEKVVPTGFHLPRIPVESFGAMVNGLGREFSALTEYLPLLVPALGHNPRRFKHFINSLNLLKRLLQNAHMTIGFETVLSWSVIEHLFMELAADIKDNPDHLFALQEHIAILARQAEGEPLWRISDDQLDARKVPQAFHRYIQQPGLAEAVSRCDITPEAFKGLRALSGTLRPGGAAPATSPTQ